MFRRKFINTLLEWKNKRGTECLLVKGARQVGKTFIIREFGKQYYKNIIELNFFLYAAHKKFFEGNLDAASIYSKLSLAFKGVKFDRDTLLFLDEIQYCGQARTALKFLAEDGRCDVVASGSMLGIAYNDIASIPVGYERQIEMFSMDFEEFLWAKGLTEENISVFRERFIKRQKIDGFMNDLMLANMREYMIVGGMPSVVQTFIKSEGNYSEVHAEQEKIISSYLDDIAKYAPAALKPKARACYLSVTRQLAKENNRKFQYSVVEKGGTARKFDTSIDWLKDAGLIKLCSNISLPQFPLVSYEQPDYFKVYVSDIGILVAMYGFSMKEKLYENTLKGPAKGGIYENLIADILLKKRLPLRYFKPGEGGQEIEFLYDGNGDIIPIEVKAGNTSSYSLNEFLTKYNPPYGYKFINGNIGTADKKITLPLYMAMFL